MSAAQAMRSIAHRGASAYAPENTFAAFELALEMGADAIETDLRQTADGEIVLLHDETVDRTTDGSGPVTDLTLAELRRLDAGSWFGERFAGERVPTLAETLDHFGHRTRLVLELKAPCEGAALNQVREWGLLPNVVFTSFDLGILERLVAEEPQAACGYLTAAVQDGLLERLTQMGLSQVCPRAEIVGERLVARAHEAGLQVRAWGVRDEDTMQHLLDCGVDGMTVNWPDRLRSEIERRGLA